MTREERNTKLKHFITCLKCEVSGRECDDNCHVQYEAGNMGEIIENLESISKELEQESYEDAISRDAVLLLIEKIKDQEKINYMSLLNLAAEVRKLSPVNPQYTEDEHKWETCFDCPLSHGCPKIKGCTNEQAIEYASKIPNDCPLSAQPEQEPCPDTISRQAVVDITWEEPSYTDALNVLTEVRDKVKALPPVTPQARVGHWIDIMVGDMPAQACDQCNTFYPLAYTGGGHKYCPNCGCAMVESKESKVKND